MAPLNLLSRVFLDLETTGLTPREHVILSMAFIVDRHIEGLEYEEADRLVVNILPSEEDWANAHPKALEVNGMTWEYLQEHGVSKQEAERLLFNFVLKNKIHYKKAYLIGQNPDFDIRFLKRHFPALQFVGFPYDDVVDNIDLAKRLEQYDFTFTPKSRGSETLSSYLGVLPEDSVHTAEGGAEAAKRNFYALRKRLDETYKKMRQAAAKGMNYPDEFPEVRAVDPELSYLDKFASWAKQEGWTRLPADRTVFIDPDGYRWAWFGGIPNMLVKLNIE